MNLCYTYCGIVPVIIEPNSVDNEYIQNINSSDSKMTIQPNPSLSILNINLESAFSGDITIRISNVLGEKIIEKTFKKDNYKSSFQIDNSFSKGLYFIQLYLNGTGKILTQKIIIN